MTGPVAERTDRELVDALGGNPHRLVPESLVIWGDQATWTERCRRRCTHDDGLCHHIRAAYVPLELRRRDEALQ